MRTSSIHSTRLFVDWGGWHAIWLPDDAFRRLIEHPDRLIRTMTWITFPDRCNLIWVAALQAEWANELVPLSNEKYQQLIIQLNDDKYAVRERAMATLLSMRHRVKSQLQETLKNSPSNEVTIRVRRILVHGDPKSLNLPESKFLDFLANRNTPPARRMLEILASGPSDNDLVLQARERLRNTPSK